MTIAPEKLRGELRRLNPMLEAGWESPKEAAALRLRLLAWQEFCRFPEENDTRTEVS